MCLSSEGLALDHGREIRAKAGGIQHEADGRARQQSEGGSAASVLRAIAGSTLEGTYFCAQGLTNARLALGQADGDRIPGVFDFWAHPSRPKRPSGSFHVYVRLERSQSTTPDGVVIDGYDVVMEPGAWIKQPDNYVTIGARLFNGSTGNGRDARLHWFGDVSNAICGRMELTEVT